MKICVITYQNFHTKDLLLILIQRVMTYKSNLESLYRSDFSAQELSLLKLLVLTELRNFRGLNLLESSGSIYELLTQIQSKIGVLQSKQL